MDSARAQTASSGQRIARAALETAAPSIPSSPLWAMPNVIVTPHVAGARPRYLELALELFIDNLTRYVTAETR